MSQRSRTRRQQKKQQQQRQRTLTILGGIIGAAVLGVLLVVIAQAPQPSEIPAGVETRYAGVTQGTTQQGFPVLGNPAAPVEVKEYSSFGCEFCRVFHEESFDDLLARVRSNEIRFVYVPLQTGAVLNQNYAARAGLCAMEQGKFWELHDVMFYWHTQYSSITPQRMPSAIDALALDGGAFNGCIDAERTTQVLDAAQSDAVAALGNVSTPQVTVNGVVVVDGSGQASAQLPLINQTIDNALAQPGVVIPPVASDATPEVIAPTGVTEPAAESTTPEATAEATAGS